MMVVVAVGAVVADVVWNRVLFLGQAEVVVVVVWRTLHVCVGRC
jgi:hypothetical protein